MESKKQRPQDEAMQQGRRQHSRLYVRLPARIQTLVETRPAVLCDLSLLGAQIETDALVQPGTEILMEWNRFDAFGEVIWNRGPRCGIVFQDILPVRTLLATRDLDDLDHLPDERDIVRESARRWVEGKLRY